MSTHRLLSVPSGDDLLAALGGLPQGSWAQGNGHVEGVELRLAGEGGDVTRALRGRLTLVSLAGPSGGPFTATLARATDVGLELLGGVLVRARSAGVTVSILSAEASQPADREPTAARREMVPPGNTPTASPPSAAAPPPPAAAARPAPAAAAPPGPSPAPSPSPAPAPGPSPAAAPAPSAEAPKTWADVASASEQATEPAGDEGMVNDEGEPVPGPGDLIDHFSFGTCEVLTSDGERLRIRDSRGTGRVREVSLEALKVMPPTRQNGKRFFRLLRRT